MSIHVYSIMRNEARILPWWLRHYERFADKIIVYDDQSDDGTREMVKRHPLCELREYPARLLDDGLHAKIFSRAYREDGRKGDWIFCVDADEFIWSHDLQEKLEKCVRNRDNVIVCQGYEMLSESFPVDDGRQLTEIVKVGYPWLTKPCVFRSSADIEFGCGRHTWNPWQKGISIWNTDEVRFLHYRDMSYDYYLWHHRRNAERLDPNRADKSWGKHNFNPESKAAFLERVRTKGTQVLP